jgi:tetratricopeptide (TPR) repeat protein
MLDWLRATMPSLACRSPQVAVALVKLALDVVADSDPRREWLEASLATVQRLLNQFHEAEQLARRVRERAVDPERAAHMAWILGYCLLGTARAEQALDVLATALLDRSTPRRWHARLRALRAVVLGAVGHYDQALAAADRARRDGQAAGDRYAVALALHAKAQTVARDDTRAGLELIDQGLAVAPDGAEGVDLRLLLLSNRLNNLTILDRSAEAASTAREALALAEGAGTARHAAIRVTAAQAHFARGAGTTRWPSWSPPRTCGTNSPATDRS